MFLLTVNSYEKMQRFNGNLNKLRQEVQVGRILLVHLVVNHHLEEYHLLVEVVEECLQHLDLDLEGQRLVEKILKAEKQVLLEQCPQQVEQCLQQEHQQQDHKLMDNLYGL
jgi:hypothetical protein